MVGTRRPKVDPNREITVTVRVRELWDAHTGMFRLRSTEFPKGHLGGAYCPCSIARALRQAEGMPEPTAEQTINALAAERE